MDGCNCMQGQVLVELEYQEHSYMQVHVVDMNIDEGNSRTHTHTPVLALGDSPEISALCLSQNSRSFCPFGRSTRELGKNKALGIFRVRL
jgi:hypothetical protein